MASKLSPRFIIQESNNPITPRHHQILKQKVPFDSADYFMDKEKREKMLANQKVRRY